MKSGQQLEVVQRQSLVETIKRPIFGEVVFVCDVAEQLTLIGMDVFALMENV